MKKNYYVQPSIVVEKTELEELICGSQTVISNLGIDYGGIDETGNITVE